MQAYMDDFRRWALVDGELQSWPTASSVPEEYFEVCCTISGAVGFVQKLGCAGISQHHPSSDYHQNCLAVLRMAVDLYGQVFESVYRGDSSPRPDNDYKIMFGTTDEKIAAFYGAVEIRQNVRGLKTFSIAKSVITDDFDKQDEEIIFFPG